MTKTARFTLRICAPLAAALLTSTAAYADNWRYAMEEGLTDPQGLYATKFKEEIEANSDHTVQIYPVGTLGESADAMEQAQAIAPAEQRANAIVPVPGLAGHKAHKEAQATRCPCPLVWPSPQASSRRRGRASPAQACLV